MNLPFTILTLIFTLSSCVTNENRNEKLDCSDFKYENGIVLHSNFKIDSSVMIVRYEKNNLKKVIDTAIAFVEDRSKYIANTYKINCKQLDTNYDYQVILNDTIRNFISSITTSVVSHGTEFMHGPIYMCEITSYNLNNIPISAPQIYIDLTTR